jgi:hypothetical protein
MSLGYNYNIGSRVIAGNIRPRVSGPALPSFARVVDVLLDDTREWLDPETNQKYPIGTIKYIRLNQDNQATNVVDYAYRSSAAMSYFPQPNEVVALAEQPTAEIQDDNTRVKVYYTDVINLWGSPNGNPLPATAFDGQNLLGKDIPLLSDINPLYPFPGDILTEGRQGQSIRIGGYKSPKNKLVDDSNNGKPFILISNGQIKTDNGVDHIVEDINKDQNSLYFLSDHKTDLIQANTKRSSYNVAPLAANQYVGNQVVINGGRLFFNAKEDSILLSATESVGLNARTLNFDAKDYLCLDAAEIFLGASARAASTKESVIRGVQLENWLLKLVSALEILASAAAVAKADTGGPVASLNLVGKTLPQLLTTLRTSTNTFQSTKVFTE